MPGSSVAFQQIKGLTLLRDLGHNRGLAATRSSPIYVVEGRCNAN